MRKGTPSSPVNREIERPILYKGVLSKLVNAALIASISCLFYFAICYPSMNATSYRASVSTRDEMRESYSLNKASGLSYEEYCSPVESFYFDSFPDGIKALYDKGTGSEHSIAYYYNVHVCQLPDAPTPADYKTAYFGYVINDDGSVNLDVKAECYLDSLGTRGLRDLSDIYHSAYLKLPDLLMDLSSDYGQAVRTISLDEGLSRLASIGFSFLLVELLLPLLDPRGGSLGEKIWKLGYADKSGFRMKKWKIPLRCLLYMALPMLGAYALSAYSVTLLWIMPLFFDELFLMLSSSNQSLPDKILSLILVDLKESTIYRDEQEKNDAESRSLSDYKDKEYVDLLSKTEETKKDPEY